MSDIFDIKDMTEEDIKLQYITPALTAKWDVKKITMETSPANKFTDGKVHIKGNIPSRDKGKRCDYVLWYNKGTPLAIVEAKDNNHSSSFGMQQAITYGIIEKMVDKSLLKLKMVDKWSVKPTLAEKLVDILHFMSDKSQITTEELVRHFDFAPTTAKRYLRQLTEFGYLEAMGGNKNRCYKLKEGEL